MVEPHTLGGETGQKRKYLSLEVGAGQQSRAQGFFPITIYLWQTIGDPPNTFPLTESFYFFKSVSFLLHGLLTSPLTTMSPPVHVSSVYPASCLLTHNSIHFPPSADSTALTASAASRAYYSIAGAVSNWHLTQLMLTQMMLMLMLPWMMLMLMLT